MKNSSTINVFDLPQQSINEQIQSWGSIATQAGLDQECDFFQIKEKDIEGIIPYRIVSGCAIAYGDPVCRQEDKPLVAEAFGRYCADKNIRLIYVLTSESFTHWAIDHHSKIMIEFGEELVFDPQNDPREGPRGRRLRNKISHAQTLGLASHEYYGEDAELEKAFNAVAARWHRSRSGPQIYLGELNLFRDRTSSRWFYIQESSNNKVIGTAQLYRIQSRGGWLLKHLLTVPEAPRGTSELLMIYILEQLKEEDCRYLTYGIVPCQSLGEVRGLGILSHYTMRGVFQFAKWFFQLNQRKTYWQKYKPESERSFILINRSGIGLSEMLALYKAFKISLI